MFDHISISAQSKNELSINSYQKNSAHKILDSAARKLHEFQVSSACQRSCCAKLTLLKLLVVLYERGKQASIKVQKHTNKPMIILRISMKH